MVTDGGGKVAEGGNARDGRAEGGKVEGKRDVKRKGQRGGMSKRGIRGEHVTRLLYISDFAYSIKSVQQLGIFASGCRLPHCTNADGNQLRQLS